MEIGIKFQWGSRRSLVMSDSSDGCCDNGEEI